MATLGNALLDSVTGAVPIAQGGTAATTASDARTSLGLGTIATQASNSVSITGGSVTGITDLAVADGGTGSSTAADARTALGLGTIATQASNSVAITGGTISGVTTTGSNLYSVGLVRASSQYASIAVGSTTGLNFNGNFTVEAYINLFSLPASGEQWGVFGAWSSSGTTNKAYSVMLESNVAAIGARVDITSDGSTSDTLRVASAYGATGWTHFAWAYNLTNKNFIFYVNGVPVGTSGTGAKTSIQTATTGSYYLGTKYDSAHYLNGLIGYLRVWDSQRSQANIAANMFKQLTTASGLVANYPLQNNYNDVSGNSNTVTSSGSPVFSNSVPFIG